MLQPTSNTVTRKLIANRTNTKEHEMRYTRAQVRPPLRSLSVASGMEALGAMSNEEISATSTGPIVSKPRIRRLNIPAQLRRRSREGIVKGLLVLIIFILIVFGTLIMSSIPWYIVNIRDRLFHTTTKRRTLPNQQDEPYLVGFITDLDRESCRDKNYKIVTCSQANVWVTYYKRAILPKLPLTKLTTLPLKWVDKVRLESRNIENGIRGMELSELIYLNNHLIAPDDRTGILYEILSPKGNLPPDFESIRSSTITPSIMKRTILRDGSGVDKTSKFKGEWAVFKDGELIIGGHGRPVTDSISRIRSTGPLWIKRIRSDFSVSHSNWTENYAKLDSAAGVKFPGYLMHEAVLWSDIRREWVFLPRRKSETPFDATQNEIRGWNCAIIASESFSNIQIRFIPTLYDNSGLRGFSSAKFLPNSNDQIVVALRTIEVDAGNHGFANRYTESFISAFNIMTGDLLLTEQRVGYKKYEGLVFL